MVGRRAFKAWGLSPNQRLEVRSRWSGQSDSRPSGRQPSCGAPKPQDAAKVFLTSMWLNAEEALWVAGNLGPG